MAISPQAGKLAEPSSLIDVAALVAAYFGETPDQTVPAQRVAFGTSGHRGTSVDKSFNEAHVAAISQAVCDYRARHGGPGDGRSRRRCAGRAGGR